MIVVIEGPDGSGKTTLAHVFGQLGRQYDLKVRHVHHSVPDNPYNEYMKTIHSGYDRDTLVVADRLHLGELVYGTVRRGKSGLSLSCVSHMCIDVYDAPGHTFVLTPGWAECRSRIWQRGTDDVPPMLPREHERFEFLAEVIKSSNPHAITHVGPGVSQEALMGEAYRVMKNLIERNEARAHPDTVAP